MKDNLLKDNSKIETIKGNIEKIRVTMHENVIIGFQNEAKLEAIERQSEELMQQAGIFKDNSLTLKRKMWWKQFKMKCIIGSICFFVLFIIVLIIALDAKK